MPVLKIPSRVERNVNEGAGATTSGSRFQATDDCIAYKFDNEVASEPKLNRSSTRECCDMATSDSTQRSSRCSTSEIAVAEMFSSSTPLRPFSTTSPQYRDAITGSFQDCASSWVKPKPSEKVGKMNTSASL